MRLLKKLVKFLYLFTRYEKLYSTAVSSEALNNATALNKEIVIIPNMIEINKDIRYEDNGNFLFIGRDEKRKNINSCRSSG